MLPSSPGSPLFCSLKDPKVLEDDTVLFCFNYKELKACSGHVQPSPGKSIITFLHLHGPQCPDFLNRSKQSTVVKGTKQL